MVGVTLRYSNMAWKFPEKNGGFRGNSESNSVEDFPAMLDDQRLLLIGGYPG